MTLASASQVQLAFFKGRSITSRIIKFITWGEYSHVGILFPERDLIVEAWHYGGVLLNRFGARHTPGTEVDIYEYVTPPTQEQILKGVAYLDKQMGKDYDFPGVLRFLTHRERKSDDKLFCSELALEFSLAMDFKLLQVPSYKASPSALASSPLLQKFRTRITR